MSSRDSVASGFWRASTVRGGSFNSCSNSLAGHSSDLTSRSKSAGDDPGNSITVVEVVLRYCAGRGENGVRVSLAFFIVRTHGHRGRPAEAGGAAAGSTVSKQTEQRALLRFSLGLRRYNNTGYLPASPCWQTDERMLDSILSRPAGIVYSFGTIRHRCSSLWRPFRIPTPGIPAIPDGTSPPGSRPLSAAEARPMPRCRRRSRYRTISTAATIASVTPPPANDA